MTRKKAVLTCFGVCTIAAVFAASAFACTMFRGTFTVAGNSGGSVTSTGLRTGMLQTISGTTSASATGGSIKVSTGRDKYAVGLQAGPYQINYYNGAAYAGNNWSQDCMTGDAGSTLKNVTVLSTGKISGQPVSVALPNGTANSAGTESEVCISNSVATFGNQAPITII